MTRTPSTHPTSPPADSAERDDLEFLDTSRAGPTVIRGGALRLVGFVLGTLATVAASAVVIRHLGVVDTGRFVTVMTLIAMVASISDLGLAAVGISEYSVKSKREGRQLLKNLLGMRIAFTLAGVGIAVLFAVLADYTATMILGIVIAGTALAFFVTQQSLTIPLQAKLRFGWITALTLIFQVGVAATAAFLAFLGAGLLPFFALQLPAILPVLALTVMVDRKSAVFPIVEPLAWRRFLSQIIPFSAAVVLSAFYFRIVQIMVSLFADGLQTGYFGVSFRILDTLTNIPPLLVLTMLPILARAAQADDGRFNRIGRRLSEAMLIAGVGLATAMFLGAQFAVDLIAGPGFEPSVDILRILAVALIGTFCIAARGYALLSLKRMRAILVSNAVAFSVVVVAGVPLIHLYGAKGGAIALVVAELTLAVAYEIALTRDRPDMRLPAGFAFRVACAATVAIVVAANVQALSSVGRTFLGAAVYCAMLFVLRAIPADLYQALRKHKPNPTTETGM